MSETLELVFLFATVIILFILLIGLIKNVLTLNIFGIFYSLLKMAFACFIMMMVIGITEDSIESANSVATINESSDTNEDGRTITVDPEYLEMMNNGGNSEDLEVTVDDTLFIIPAMYL